MNDQRLVSVIIIFLDAEPFIEEAIVSVLAQTYENWELLLVDDGSTDASTEIALRYVERYSSKILYFDHEGHHNRGQSASRNLGIKNSKGEYIAFLDADDVWLPQKLKEQVAVLASQPKAAMVYGPAQVWLSWREHLNDLSQDRIQRLRIQPNSLMQPPTLLTLFLRHENTTPSPSGILVQRNVVEKVGGFEDAFRGNYSSYEDQAFYAKICLKAPVFVANEGWYKYRLHPNSHCIVAKKTGVYYSARLYFLKWLAEYLSKEGVKDPRIRNVLQMQLWIYSYPMIIRRIAGMLRLLRQMKSLLRTKMLQIFPISTWSNL